MASVFERGWKPLSAALDALGVAAFACVFGAINLQVFMRYIAHRPVSWSEEFPTLAFAVAVLWAAAVTLRAADHIVFELLTDLLPRKLQLVVAALAYAGVAAIFAVATLMTAPPSSLTSLMKSTRWPPISSVSKPVTVQRPWVG